MQIEIWKDIKGYKGIYRASNWGRIKSLKYNKEKILKPKKSDKYGHLLVKFCKKNRIRGFQVHRLVLETFVGPCPPGMQCRHLDGNPANNRLDNLKWGTRSENQQDSIRHGTKYNGDQRGEKNPSAKLNEKQVHIIKWLCVNTDMTDLEIAKIFGVSSRSINSIRNNKTWKHIGIAGDKNG